MRGETEGRSDQNVEVLWNSSTANPDSSAIEQLVTVSVKVDAVLERSEHPALATPFKNQGIQNAEPRVAGDASPGRLAVKIGAVSNSEINGDMSYSTDRNDDPVRKLEISETVELHLEQLASRWRL